jgi:ribosomal-protein-alanine N-acetyltransferase
MSDLKTERLLIRTFQPEDLSDIHRILDLAFGTSRDVAAEQARRERESWLHWSTLNQTWLPNLHQPPYGDRAVVLRSTGELIGAVGYVPLLAPFHQIPQLRAAGVRPGHYTPEVGLFWVIDPSYQQQGFATEAAHGLVRDGFQNLHLHRILAMTGHTNEASQAVMRNLGMLLVRNPLPEPEWLQVVGILENTL